MRRFLIILSMACLFAALAAKAENPLELSDPDGKVHRPLSTGDKKGVVLIFISRDCPISNAFVPEVNRLAMGYQRDFAFWLIHADPGISAADAKKHAEVFEIKAPVLLDPGQHLVELTHAKVTPEAVVLGTEGKILYQGRINDLYAALTKKRLQATTQDLRDALDAVIAGKPVANATTKAIGCSITPK